MDLTPLYDLRERLKTGAIAGTGLIPEDFRLSRALEAMEPLEGASPVFARISQSVRALLAADGAGRASALLSALALCDAVIVTQGNASAAGELGPVRLCGHGGTVRNVPYSVLQPLLSALTGSGGGRYNLIMELHETKPQLFSDYRVVRALIGSLGDSYSEIADRAESWLCEEGPGIVPLLKDGFDPCGRGEMQRRLRIIEETAGAAENDFYLSLLETAEKEIRALAVYALRLDEKNAQTLVDLAKTEKGNVKKQALWAMAQMKSAVVWEYLRALAGKKPEAVAEYMQLSEAEEAGKLIAGEMARVLAVYEADPSAEITAEIQERLQRYIQALPGKRGTDIGDIYRRAAALKTTLDRPVTGGDPKKPMWLNYGGYGKFAVFSQAMVLQLIRSIAFHPMPELTALAEELYRDFGDCWLAPAIMAALLSKPAAECYSLASPLVSPGGVLFKKKLTEEQKICLDQVLSGLHWDEKTGTQQVTMRLDNPAGGTVLRSQRLAEKLDPRWYEALLKFGVRYEELAAACFDRSDENVVKLLQKHFYSRAVVVPKNVRYFSILKLLGWNECKGLATRYLAEEKRPSIWQIRNLFNILPGTAEGKAEEAEAVLQMVTSGKLKFLSGDAAGELGEIIAAYQNGAESI